MLECKPAREDQYDKFFRFIENEDPGYIENAMRVMKITWEELRYLFRTVGEVWGIYFDDELAGFYWIEKRQNVLHLHALVLKKEFRRKGIGTWVLNMLEDKYRESIDAIELGVHKSNEVGISLYRSLGYRTVKVIEDLGFWIMKKQLTNRV